MRALVGALAPLLVLAGAVASAQPPAAARDEAFKIIDAYVISNLQDSLGLTDDQFVKMLPLVKRLQDDRRGFAQRRMRAVLELRQAFRAGNATEGMVAERLKELKDIEAQEGPALRKHRDAIDAALNPLQQAKFRVMEVEVEQKIRQLMSKAREEGASRRGPRRPDP